MRGHLAGLGIEFGQQALAAGQLAGRAASTLVPSVGSVRVLTFTARNELDAGCARRSRSRCARRRACGGGRAGRLGRNSSVPGACVSTVLDLAPAGPHLDLDDIAAQHARFARAAGPPRAAASIPAPPSRARASLVSVLSPPVLANSISTRPTSPWWRRFRVVETRRASPLPGDLGLRPSSAKSAHSSSAEYSSVPVGVALRAVGLRRLHAADNAVLQRDHRGGGFESRALARQPRPRQQPDLGLGLLIEDVAGLHLHGLGVGPAAFQCSSTWLFMCSSRGHGVVGRAHRLAGAVLEDEARGAVRGGLAGVAVESDAGGRDGHQVAAWAGPRR